jgi:hypothetical protein
MMVPTVHLNGTSREELCLQLEDACDAVRVAITKLRAAWPHGRDYYPQGPDAHDRALGEYNSRLKRLKDVENELIVIWETTAK